MKNGDQMEKYMNIKNLEKRYGKKKWDMIILICIMVFLSITMYYILSTEYLGYEFIGICYMLLDGIVLYCIYNKYVLYKQKKEQIRIVGKRWFGIIIAGLEMMFLCIINYSIIVWFIWY